MSSISLGEEEIPSNDPDLAWQMVSADNPVKQLPILDIYTPQPPDTIRIVCMSDTHGATNIDNIPHGDIFIHAGDFTNTGHPNEVDQFDAWLGTLPHKHKLVIAGNHDLIFDSDSYPMIWDRFHKRCFNYAKIRSTMTHCTYLEDNDVTLYGYKFYGTPWQPEFCKWGFNLKRGSQLREKWRKIPVDTDILITHTPPLGYGDQIFNGARVGCVDLLQTIKQIKPMYSIYGHIHE
eukprot:Ihof_evm2s458 gene=Ihof_evmTU2s458